VQVRSDQIRSDHPRSFLLTAATLTLACCGLAGEAAPQRVAQHEQAIVADVAPEPAPIYTEDCGGTWTPPLVGLRLVGWPTADEAPPTVAGADTISLAVRNDAEAGGTLTVRANASSQRGASGAELFRGEIGGREEAEIALSVEPLALPERGLDLLGQIVLVAVVDNGSEPLFSDTLTLYFRPLAGGVALYDLAAKLQQAADGAVTDEGRALVREAVENYGAMERPDGVPNALDPSQVSFAYDLPADANLAAEDAPLDDVIFDDRGGEQ
jgi:hypothetical protein